MRKIVMFVCILAAFAVAKDNECYTIGSNLIGELSGCYLEESSSDAMYYTCDNGFVFIEKATGGMSITLEDARGKLTLAAGRDACGVQLLDEYDVAVIPGGLLPKGDNGKGLYFLFKKKFMSSSVSSVVDSRCPPSWQDSNGVCDPRYFE